MESHTLDALKWMVSLLNKHKIPYQISGGFAAKVFGSARSLNDIDFDIPEDCFGLILSEIRPYIIFGPKKYRDGKWDTELITLNYNGQEIDISGANNTRITTKDRKKWIPFHVDFSRNLNIEIYGIKVKIIAPEDLIKYKKHLDGSHQIVDIKSAKKYIYGKKNNKFTLDES